MTRYSERISDCPQRGIILLLQPILYTLFVFFVTTQTSLILEFVPQVTIFSNNVPSSYLPKIPQNTSVIWELFSICQKNSTTILTDASDVIGFNFTTHNQLNQFVTEIKSGTQTGLINTFWRFVSLANILWLVAICGIALTVIPFAHAIFGPLVLCFCNLLAHIVLFLYQYAEQIGYFLACFILAQAMYLHPDTGMYISLTSLTFYYALCVYTLNTTIDYDKNAYRHIKPHDQFLFLLPATIILASYYESQLLGFMSVAILYMVLGFGIDNYGLCLIVGFNDKNATLNCIFASLMLIPLYGYFLSNQNISSFFQPYYYGVYVFGVIVYYLALLISSSSFIYNTMAYGHRQISMIISLCVGFYFGTSSGNACVCNVALTFMVLYATEKYTELACRSNFMIIYTFSMFVGLYFVAMWLNVHPEFISQIVSGVSA